MEKIFKDARKRKGIARKALEAFYSSEEDPDDPSYQAGAY